MFLITSLSLSTPFIPIHLHLLIPFPPTSVKSLLKFSFKLTAYLRRLALPLSVSFFQPLSLTPVTVSKVLMRSYLTLHCLIRCCWVSKFAAPISRGQLNAILCWISPCNLVCCSPAAAYICAMTVDWPLGGLLLRHTTVHLHAKQPTQCYKMSRSALYCHAVISNDSAKCVAILNAYLYFYGIAAVKSRDISLLPKCRYLLKWFFLCMRVGVFCIFCIIFFSISMHMCSC